MPDSLRPHGLKPTRLLCPWDFPGKDTGVCCHFLLQGIFSTQGSNPSLLHCRWILHHLSHWREPVASLTLVELIVISSTLHLKQYNPQTSLYPQMVKNLPADAGGPGSIPRDDPLDKGVATHSSILNWRIPWAWWTAVAKSQTRLSTRFKPYTTSQVLSLGVPRTHYHAFPPLYL